MSETRPLDLDEIRRRLEGAEGPRYWRSLEEIAGTEEFRDFLSHEFPENADQWSDAVSRRRFLQLMGASFALAGLSACTRQPVEKIVPYVEQPEGLVPGKPLFFATALPWRGFARGVLAESHMGRPTKLDGNPEHPSFPGGGSDTFLQASILALYDPDRAQVVSHAGSIGTWEAMIDALRPALEAERVSRGAGLRLLTGTVTSPTLASQIRALLEQFPQARWHQYEAVCRDNARAGARLALGEDVDVQLRFDRARVVLSFDDDFLAGHPAALRHIRDFASGRRARSDFDELSRLYVVEASPTLAGAAADHRLARTAGGIENLAHAIASRAGIATASPSALTSEEEKFVSAAWADLSAHRGSSLVVAGEGQPPPVHALFHAINQALSNFGTTVLFTEPVEAEPALQIESLRELSADMAAGRVELLVILGGNPVFDAPADFDFRLALSKVKLAVRLGLHEDETSEWCHWNVPAAHPLESWSDLSSYDGTVSIQQPLIAPLYKGRSPHELLAALLGAPDKTSHDAVKEHWKSKRGGAEFEKFWRKSLHDGFIADTALPGKSVSVKPGLDFGRMGVSLAASNSGGALEAVFRPDPTIWDGEFANNGWLQELPKPLTRLTWDNAALMSIATAGALGVSNGDVVELRLDGRSVEAPVWIVPGHADGSVTIPFGYGRTKVGAVGRGTGFNAYRLRSSRSPWSAPGLEVRKTGRRALLAATQYHHAIDGMATDENRGLVRSAKSVAEFRRNPSFAREIGEDPPRSLSLYPDFAPTEYAWGMAIDLNTCIGCGACVAACQAENNSPVVGKEQVLRGREMHWIRIDRYYEGPPENPATYFQPVLCMHCEKAPCEVVCPVGATVHSPEGLNEMVYNRCVGTRYCSNNCPYKVRRFNFLQYSDNKTPSLKLLRNPNVTVRSRGVMEKCSYCVQRISNVRIEAEKRGTPIRDGEVRTACEQACPAQAIVFGNVGDPTSRASKLKAEPLNYGLLTDLNTRPRTTYLAKVWNPNPALAGGKE